MERGLQWVHSAELKIDLQSGSKHADASKPEGWNRDYLGKNSLLIIKQDCNA